MNIYLTATYFRTPLDAKKTSEVGYMKTEGNYQLEETVNFVRTVSKKDMRNCNVIIDVINQEVIKCSLGELKGQNYEQIFSYFYKNYTGYFDRLFKAMGVNTEDAKGDVVVPNVINITADEIVA